MKKRIAAAMLACCLILLSACAERQTKLSDKSFDEEIRAKAQLGEQYDR